MVAYTKPQQMTSCRIWEGKKARSRDAMTTGLSEPLRGLLALLLLC